MNNRFTRWLDLKGYDDRGMIYIKYGPPDDKVEEVIGSGTNPVTSWVYNHSSENNFMQ